MFLIHYSSQVTRRLPSESCGLRHYGGTSVWRIHVARLHYKASVVTELGYYAVSQKNRARILYLIILTIFELNYEYNPIQLTLH